MTEYIGFAVAACTTLAFLPRVVKTYLSRPAQDLSLGIFSILTSGLWLTCGC